MIRNLIVALILSSVAFNVSCGSKKKKDDAAAGNPDGSVVTKDMQFDPAGSDSGKIEGLSTIYFGYDEATLTSAAREELSTNANWIKAHANVTVQIEGHTDERGSVEYNLALGERRAKAAKNYLVSLGIEPNRLTIISYGKEKPLVEGDDEQARSKNRRANFVPLPQ